MERMSIEIRGKKMRINHIVFGLLLGAVISYMFLAFFIISEETIFTLIMFNFLFISLTFPLNGTLQRKISMLLIGNVICLFWTHFFSLFAATVCSCFGGFYNALFIILSPFLNLIWIVSFWSISLTQLTNSEKRESRTGS
jgi:hypothetical protein